MKQFLRTAISVLALGLAWSLAAIASPDTLRVLSIANSFGADAVEQNLHEIALADGSFSVREKVKLSQALLDEP